MKSYLVTYDLIKRKDYPELIKALNEYKTTWHCLGSVWIIKTDESAAILFKNLRPHIDSDDKLIVAQLNGDAMWSLSFSEKCRAWLKKYL